jgi:hypothetical protein
MEQKAHLIHLEAPMPLDRGGISGDLTGLSSTNGALRAVKGTEEGSAPRVFEDSASSRLIHLEAPIPLDRGGISGDLIDFRLQPGRCGR